MVSTGIRGVLEEDGHVVETRLGEDDTWLVFAVDDAGLGNQVSKYAANDDGSKLGSSEMNMDDSYRARCLYKSA